MFDKDDQQASPLFLAVRDVDNYACVSRLACFFLSFWNFKKLFDHEDGG